MSTPIPITRAQLSSFLTDQKLIMYFEKLFGEVNSSTVDFAKYADDAAYADNAGHATTADSATNAINATNAIYTPAGKPFRKSATLVSSTAGTPVSLVTDLEVGTGKKVYLMGFLLKVNGATAWTSGTATVVRIQDTAASPVVGISIAKAQLIGNSFLVMDSTGVTVNSAVFDGAGFTSGKGITIAGDANFTNGSDIKVSVFGYIDA